MTQETSYLTVFQESIYYQLLERHKSKLELLSMRKNETPQKKVRLLFSLGVSYIDLAIGEIVIHCNIKEAKKCFYLSAKCQQVGLLAFEKYPVEVSESYVSIRNYRQLMCALISDHTEFIQEFAQQIGGRAKIDREHAHPFDRHVGYAVKWLVLGEDDQVMPHIEKLRKMGTGKPVNQYSIYANLLQALVDNNQAGIQVELERLLKSHRRNRYNKNSPEEIFCIPAAAFAKIALMRGMQVEIDDPLCPKEVLERHEIEYPVVPELDVV